MRAYYSHHYDLLHMLHMLKLALIIITGPMPFPPFGQPPFHGGPPPGGAPPGGAPGAPTSPPGAKA